MHRHALARPNCAMLCLSSAQLRPCAAAHCLRKTPPRLTSPPPCRARLSRCCVATRFALAVSRYTRPQHCNTRLCQRLALLCPRSTPLRHAIASPDLAAPLLCWAIPCRRRSTPQHCAPPGPSRTEPNNASASRDRAEPAPCSTPLRLRPKPYPTLPRQVTFYHPDGTAASGESGEGGA